MSIIVKNTISVLLVAPILCKIVSGNMAFHSVLVFAWIISLTKYNAGEGMVGKTSSFTVSKRVI